MRRLFTAIEWGLDVMCQSGRGIHSDQEINIASAMSCSDVAEADDNERLEITPGRNKGGYETSVRQVRDELRRTFATKTQESVGRNRGRVLQRNVRDSPQVQL